MTRITMKNLITVPTKVQRYLRFSSNSEAAKYFSLLPYPEQLDIVYDVYELGYKNLALIERESGANVVYFKIHTLAQEDKQFLLMAIFNLPLRVVKKLNSFWYCQKLRKAIDNAKDNIVFSGIPVPTNGVDVRESIGKLKLMSIPFISGSEYPEIVYDVMWLLYEETKNKVVA